MQYQAKEDLLLLGDFDARLGEHTGDDKTNGNADLMKEFMSSALHDGASGQFKCIINASKSFANFTCQSEGEHSSIIDYLLTSLPSLPRYKRSTWKHMTR
jgi:hypothetical protein